jgi:antitoxin HicB
MNIPRDYLKLPYARTVIPLEEGGFHAEILEFPGCYAQGGTIDEAYKNLETTAESWIQASLDRKQDIPEPTSSVGYSGRVVLRLPRSLHRQASKHAARDRTSLNTYFVNAVAAKVGAEDFYNALERRFVQAAIPFVTYIASTAVTTPRKFDPRWKPEQIASTTDVLPNIPVPRR